MSNSFSILSSIIHQRRSTKPASMNGGIIPNETVQSLLELANWAPNHGNTQPWLFLVYTGRQLKKFCQDHAELYKRYTAPEKYMQPSYDKIIDNGTHASHIIVAIMQRGNLPKIPVIEELAAASCAVQNILLGATASGLANFWSTSGMTHHVAMKEYLGLKEEDVVMGLIFLGYTENNKQGRRGVGIEEKVRWM